MAIGLQPGRYWQPRIYNSMSPRDTTTGRVLENMILPALVQAGYSYFTQVNIGQRLGGGRHIIDVLAEKDAKRFLISMKWQQVGGTAEQKVPFEVISLIDAVRSGRYAKAYLVLGGEGWSLREFYTGGGLDSYIEGMESVDIISLESFVAEVNRGDL